MCQEEQVHSLVHRLQLHLALSHEETVVGGDAQGLQATLGRLQAQVLNHRHTKGTEHQIGAPCGLQLTGQLTHLVGHLFRCEVQVRHRLSYLPSSAHPPSP